MSDHPPGPREPWRTLGTPPMILAVAFMGAVAFGGVVLTETLCVIGERWRRVEPWVLGACMALMAVLVCLQAFGFNFPWSEEACTLAAAAVVWFGLPLLVARRQLLSVEIGRLPRTAVGRWVAVGATALFLIAILILAFQAMPPSWNLRTDTLRIPKVLLWWIVPLALFLTLCAVMDRHSTGREPDL